VPGHLVVGLGNPGPRYRATRHNAGFLLIERLASRWDIVLDRTDPSVVWGEGRIAAVPVALAEPTTLMNASGNAVAALARALGPGTVVIAFDDLDLPAGAVRVRGGGGGSGGHRGVASVIDAIGPDFVRVRLGIGRPPPGAETIDYVLGDLTADERPVIEGAIARAAEGVATLVADGLEAAMRLCNGPPPLAIGDPIG